MQLRHTQPTQQQEDRRPWKDGEKKKTSESTTNLPYARRLQNFTNRTTTALQYCWLLCSALFLYAFATLLGLYGGCVGWLNTTTTHPSFQGRRNIWKSEGACSNLKLFEGERVCFYSCQNRGRGTVFWMGFYVDISWESRCSSRINVWGHLCQILVVFEVPARPWVKGMSGNS